jgi:hypothetical protein
VIQARLVGRRHADAVRMRHHCLAPGRAVDAPAAAGECPGPVGGRLVGEVLVGIVDADGESWRPADPSWRPTLPGRQPGRFGLADLLAFSAEVAEAAD